jgi:uncharacterized protein YneF (UPF0154 family)
MNEILLTITILILCGTLAGSYYISWKEREKLLKMFMAKDLREVTDNEVLEKLPKQEEQKPSDLVNMDDVIEDEALFDRHIAAVKAQAKEEFEKGQDIT